MKIEVYVLQTVWHQFASYLSLGHFVDEMLRVVETIPLTSSMKRHAHPVRRSVSKA
ncbi:hypothetical protein [Candidatus Scalindua japonica]|uniref:hypothetical protein n=1 Tax=Candidatus Scalindua japonica TaxID=1284222 RepID=UPI0013A582A4|nr:hypothetical protein [Candidatus Scalindua japonica]